MKGKIFLGVMFVVGLVIFVFAPAESLWLLVALRVTGVVFITISAISFAVLRSSQPEIETSTRSQRYREVGRDLKLDHARFSRLGDPNRAREMGDLSEPDSHYMGIYRHH